MKALKQILNRGCISYTCLSLLLLLVNLIVTAAMGDNLERAPIPALTFFLLFPFGVTMAAAALLRTHLAPGLGRLCHYLITVLSLWLFLLLPSGVRVSPSTMLVLLVAVSAIYWAFVGIVALTKGRFRRIMRDSDLQ